MSGHSKWSTIKRKKGEADKKRGKIFTRIIHEITVAVREGGGPSVDSNPRLRFAVDKAKAANMPNENIDRAIKRASGEFKGEESYELTYEGYGPGGVAVIVDVVTDNKNRTVGEIRYAFSRSGGNLGENGCVAWMFEKKGLIVVPKGDISEDDIMTLALESGADDVSEETDCWEITCEPSMLAELKTGLETKVTCSSADVASLPKTRITISGKEAEQMMKLMEALEDLDDVIDVATNCDFEE
jgi:YebC/PmpR family DNA-binding regulatory protein